MTTGARAGLSSEQQETLSRKRDSPVQFRYMGSDISFAMRPSPLHFKLTSFPYLPVSPGFPPTPEQAGSTSALTALVARWPISRAVTSSCGLERMEKWALVGQRPRSMGSARLCSFFLNHYKHLVNSSRKGDDVTAPMTSQPHTSLPGCPLLCPIQDTLVGLSVACPRARVRWNTCHVDALLLSCS